MQMVRRFFAGICCLMFGIWSSHDMAAHILPLTEMALLADCGT
jgi:hypothetical protein